MPGFLLSALFIAALFAVPAQALGAEWHIQDNATGGDCSAIGNWNTGSKTCTLSQDLSKGVIIDSNTITLDGNGHAITGNNTGNGVSLNGRIGVTLKNLKLMNFGFGIFLSSSSNNTLISNTVSNNIVHGIVLDSSSNNTLRGNTASDNVLLGILLQSSSANNTLTSNTTSGNFHGIVVGSSNNVLTNNTFSNNVHSGIIISSSGNIVVENIVTNNSDGIHLESAGNNMISGNMISANATGIDLFFSDTNNSTYNNNFVGNSTQASVSTDSSGNVFNGETGGNYWSDYDAPAEGCTNANSDNFCDAPYTFSGGQDNLPWTKKDTWLLEQHICCSNVLFLPGIGGSRLYIPGRRGGMARIWEPLIPELGPFRSVTVSNLFLKEDGSSGRPDITTKDVVDRTERPDNIDIYVSFELKMDALKNNGIIDDWEAIPYDWRLSLDDILTKGNQVGEDVSYIKATTTPFIVQELRRLAANSKTDRVTIIAHSNGGLVTKNLVAMLGQEASALIDKIIFVAVPQVGTPQGLAGLLHGFGQGLGPGGILLSDANARTLAQNMPVAYNLLPSAGYFSSAAAPVITFDDSLPKWIERYGKSIDTFEELQRFLTDTNVTDCNDQFLIPCRVKSFDLNTTMPASINGALLSNANNVHGDTLDGWHPPQGVEFITVAGWGTTTLSQIKYKAVTQTRGVRRGQKEVINTFFKPQYTIDGDGTVMESSALWANDAPSAKYWMNLSSYNASTHGSYDHGTIFAAKPVQDLLEYIIEESHVALPTHISTSSPGAGH